MVCCTVKIITIVKKWNKCWTTCLKIFLYLSHLLTQIVSDLIVIPFNIYCSVGSMPTVNNTWQNRCKACTQILQIDTITQRRESILPSVIKFYSSSIPSDFWQFAMTLYLSLWYLFCFTPSALSSSGLKMQEQKKLPLRQSLEGIKLDTLFQSPYRRRAGFQLCAGLFCVC